MRRSGADERRAAPAPAVVDAETTARLLVSTTEPFVLLESAIAQVPPQLRPTDPRDPSRSHRCTGSRTGSARSSCRPPATTPISSTAGSRCCAGSPTSRRSRSAAHGGSTSSSGSTNSSRASTRSSGRPILRPLEFTFLSRRAEMALGGADDDDGTPTRWGAHIHPEDREPARIRLRAAIADGGDHHLEYPGARPRGPVDRLRDFVHVVHDAHGAAVLSLTGGYHGAPS